jgi:hypothetical protein
MLPSNMVVMQVGTLFTILGLAGVPAVGGGVDQEQPRVGQRVGAHAAHQVSERLVQQGKATTG